MKFQSKQGINTEKFEQVKQDRLDNQLKDFMAKAKEAKQAEAEAKEEPPKKEQDAQPAPVEAEK